MYAQLALRQAVMIGIGKESPLVPFTVEADPPSVYWVFAVRADRIAGLAGRLGLPTGIRPVPLRALPGDEPAHLLTLNVYRVSGITNGLRAEWSIYVDDPHTGVPRYLVIDARSSTRSMDPVDVFTRASTVRHERSVGQLTTLVGDDPTAFTATITLHPDHHDLPAAECAPEFVSANDHIYWLNGICDRTFYDAGLARPSMVRVADGSCELDDRSPWADLVDPVPRHVLVFRDAITFVVSPWNNVDDLAH